MPDTLYSTQVTATGDRNGSIRRDDGLLDLKLAMPERSEVKPMGPTQSKSSPAEWTFVGRRW